MAFGTSVRSALTAATLLTLFLLCRTAWAQAATAASQDSERQWADREAALGESNTLAGGVGLLHTQHAQGGAPGQLRVAFTTEYFRAGFLCTPSFPCANPSGGAPITGDTLDHIGGTISLSATLLQGLEAYVSTLAYSNADDANKPSLLGAIGDTDFGVKVFGGLTKVLFVGGGADLLLVNGADAVGLSGSGTSARFRAIGTADLRGTEARTPLRLSLNATYWLDNSGNVLESVESAAPGRGAPITRIERFGLGINRVDHVDVNLGAETFLADERVRPFVEYQADLPVNRQHYKCPTNNSSHDGCLANDSLVSSKLTLGSRFYPWRKGFSVLAALDVGLTGVADFIEEVTPTPPWTLYLGLGWPIDTWDRPPVVQIRNVEKVVEVTPPPLGHLQGFVHPKDKAEGIADAVVVFDNHPDLTSRVTGKDGHFTAELPEGTYKLVIRATGYKEGGCEGDLPAGGQDIAVDCALEPALVQITAQEVTIAQEIQFALDSAEILPASFGLMTEIADTLNKNPRLKRVEVQGHTDSSGTPAHNKTLSEQRANSVRDWLTAHGVGADRLVAKGYGQDKPLVPNDSEERRARNRRVQFIIVDQAAEGTPPSP